MKDHARMRDGAPGLDAVPHRCRIKIQGIYHTLQQAERRAADAILAAPREIPQGNIVRFARRARCSEATLVRLSRKLGYGGFAELKADFARGESQTPYEGIDPGDSPEVVVRKIFADSIQALTDTLEVIDMEAYRGALSTLLAAKRLAFLGLGNAAVVAREACQKFLRIGVPAYTAEDPDLQLIITNTQLSRGDALVAVSYSGESLPIIHAARQARARGVVVLAITNFPRSTLAKASDRVLLTAVFQEHLNGEVASKRLAQLCVIESLYTNYLLRRGPAARRALLVSNEAVGANKTSRNAKRTERKP